jgi:hypothetical protein
MENTDLNTIPFNDLASLKDVETMVWTGLLLKKADLPDVEACFKQMGLLKEGKLVDAKNISGNVLGYKGRCDVVLFFEGAVLGNAAARLCINGLKWTSDFRTNYSKDYI